MIMGDLKRFVKSFAIMHILMFLSCEALEPIMDYQLLLRKNLMDVERYDRVNAPPEVNFGNESLNVWMNFMILHVYELEEISGSLTTNGWMLLTWYDSRLKWNPDDYGSQYDLPAPKSSVWSPNIKLFNSAEYSNTYSFDTPEIVYIWHEGFVMSGTPVTFKSTCSIDHRLYPFDEHTCNIVLGSWAHFGDGGLNLNVWQAMFVEQSLKVFKTDNPQWIILERSQSIQNRSFSNPGVNGQTVNMQIRLRRQAPLFKFMVIIPGILAMILTVALFWLPSDSSAKLTVGSIAVGIQMALALMLGQQIPSGGQYVPVIVLLVGNSLILSALSITISVYVIRATHSKNKTDIPECLKKILTGPIGRLFCNFKRRRSIGEERLLDPDMGEIEQSISEVESEVPVDERWLDVGLLVDRFCFMLYCIAFLIICLSSFT